MYAPIIVFAYNRPKHLEKTLTALSKNAEAKESMLFIFIDGPKDIKDSAMNKQVYLRAKQFEYGHFKNVTIIKSKKNQGLARAVINGVTEIINQYNKVIVTEDDAVCATSYLKFMNGALEYYENNPLIWSVGGYTVPIELPEDYLHDVILTQRSSSYAWGTWKNRWDKIDWEVKDYRKMHWDFRLRKRFNYWGDDRALMLDDQMLGKVNSWAIRFDYAMFKQQMFNILPSYSLINNIGHDGSGTHSTIDESKKDPFGIDLAKAKKRFKFENVKVDERIKRNYCYFFRLSSLYRLKHFVVNMLGGIL